MDGQRWTRDPWDRDPRFEPHYQEGKNTEPGALANTVEGRLRQIELALSELLSGEGDERFRVTIWETNPPNGAGRPQLNPITLTDDHAIARGRLN